MRWVGLRGLPGSDTCLLLISCANFLQYYKKIYSLNISIDAMFLKTNLLRKTLNYKSRMQTTHPDNHRNHTPIDTETPVVENVLVYLSCLNIFI